MNLLYRLLYSKLYSEEVGGESNAGGGSETSTGEPSVGDGTEESGTVLSGGENGDGVELFAGKYKSVEELEKGYKESVSMGTKNTEKMNSMTEKLKGFSGSPEGDYEVAEGQEQFNDAVMSEISTWGKENGLSQEAFSGLLSTVHAADVKAAEATRDAEMAKLGKDAGARIQNTTDKLNTIFGEKLADKFLYIGQDAEGVEALEALVAKFGDTTVNPDGSGVVNEDKIKQSDIDELMHKKDSAGMMKMQTDPEYAAEVYAKIGQYNKQRGV